MQLSEAADMLGVHYQTSYARVRFLARAALTPGSSTRSSAPRPRKSQPDSSAGAPHGGLNGGERLR
jgi:hypothetical protein